jgi:hypothetical protein
VPGYRPRWSVRKGAQELYDAYRREGLTLEDFEGERYKRIDHIRLLVRRGHLDGSLRPIGREHAA